MARTGWLVTVRFEQPGSPWAERSIDGQLDGAHCQHVISVTDKSSSLQCFSVEVLTSYHHPQSHLQRAFVDASLEHLDRAPSRAGVLEASDSLVDNFLRRKFHLVPGPSGSVIVSHPAFHIPAGTVNYA